MPVRMTPEQFAEKHARRLKASTADIKRGIENVTESPTAKAADASTKMLQNLTEAVNSGKWGRRLKAVSLEDWKAATINKGLARIPAGIDAAHDKQVAFAGQLFPFEDRVMAMVDKLDDLTLDDSIARVTLWMREMSKFEMK